MSNFQSFKSPREENLLICFADLTNFSKYAMKRADLETFDYISHFCEIVGDEIESKGGKIIKFIGDEVLMVFPENLIDEGILALLNLKRKVDNFNKDNNLDSQLIIKCNFGKVVIGMLGTKKNKRLDIIGKEVNTTALLKSNGFVMTAETFRKLKSETRKLFKKHTPPITYIPLEERHKI